MKKSIVIIIIILGLILIGGGLFLNNNSKEEKPTKKDEPIQKDDNYSKKYETVKEQTEATFVETTEEEQKENSSKIGFTDVTCENGGCTMSKQVGSNPEDKDTVSVVFYEGKLEYVSIRLQYLPSTFDTKVVTNDLNKLLHNYIGISIEESMVAEGKEEFLKITDGSTYYKEYEQGEYTVMYIMGEYHNLYNCSVQVVLTSRYKQ